MQQQHTPSPDEPGDRPHDEPGRVNPDSPERLAEEHPEPPHPPSRYDAGAGQGTVTGPPKGETQDRPILDGSTQTFSPDASVPNPTHGQTDQSQVAKQPALNTSSTTRWLVAGNIAAVIFTLLLLLVMRWNIPLATIGIALIIAVLVAMVFVRRSSLPRRRRLRIEAILLAVLCVPCLAIVLIILGTNIDAIKWFPS